ncbi:MAG TPA: hypothetical protein VKN18_07035 [Blastocatellia bacterium]|nr:hypothetical protein [Blastocatellia bacterium]
MILASRVESYVPKGLVAALLIICLAPVFEAYAQKKAPAKKIPAKTAVTKQPTTPYGLGYQKGYSDGFAQGEADWRSNARPDFRRSDKWQQRDSGSSDDYRIGYDLGFELAYSDGYYGRLRDAEVPRNGEVIAKAAALADQERAGRANQDRKNQNNDRFDRPEIGSGQQDQNPPTPAPLSIPAGTELRIRLGSAVSTKTGRVGDKFTATVVSPSTYETAIVEGHIASLNKSGKISGTTEVGLSFDSVTFPDGRSARIDGQLVKVYESESVKKVDEEGRIETGSRTRDSQVRGGIGAAAGAILGGIVGGGKGALIGVLVGGAAGVGTVYVDGNKDLILDAGTEMVIRIARTQDR